MKEFLVSPLKGTKWRVESRVSESSTHQIVVFAILNDSTILNQDDSVGLGNGRQPVSDEDDRDLLGLENLGDRSVDLSSEPETKVPDVLSELVLSIERRREARINSRVVQIGHRERT